MIDPRTGTNYCAHGTLTTRYICHQCENERLETELAALREQLATAHDTIAFRNTHVERLEREHDALSEQLAERDAKLARVQLEFNFEVQHR